MTYPGYTINKPSIKSENHQFTFTSPSFRIINHHESSLTIINHTNPIGSLYGSIVTPLAFPQTATAHLVVVHVVVDVTMHDALDGGAAGPDQGYLQVKASTIQLNADMGLSYSRLCILKPAYIQLTAFCIHGTFAPWKFWNKRNLLALAIVMFQTFLVFWPLMYQ